MSEKGRITRGRLGSLSLRKDGERQCFLFSKHLIICTRGSGGKLHLTKVGASVPSAMPLLTCHPAAPHPQAWWLGTPGAGADRTEQGCVTRRRDWGPSPTQLHVCGSVLRLGQQATPRHR